MSLSFYVAAVVVVFVALRLQPRINLPAHLLGHKAIFDDQLLGEAQRANLALLVKEAKEFPTNSADTNFYKFEREHVGEAVPLNAKGGCDHPFLVPNLDKTLCILPGRIDVARHFLKHGGVHGKKEAYETMVSRIMSFGKYMFDPKDNPAVDALFKADKFQQLAKAVCPDEKQVLDPFQYNYILQIPGQSVALHADAVYFWGATRFQIPQWLLTVMQFSGLWQDQFIDQVQVVAYLHSWNDTDLQRDGRFVYWDAQEPQPKHVYPLPGAGSAVDGSKTIHAAEVYWPGVTPPIIKKDKPAFLRYKGDDQWTVEQVGADGKRHTLRDYVTDDLRQTIVYRARCFRSEEERETFKNWKSSDNMSLEQIFGKLRTDLIKRGVLPDDAPVVDTHTPQDRLQFALTLLDEYVAYPPPYDAWIVYNYCALTLKWPLLKTPLSLLGC